MKDERWITITSYSDIRDANADADLLKSQGIHCKTVLYEPEAVLFVEPMAHDWIFLEIYEEDFELAADVLDLEPYTVDDFERDEVANYEDAKDEMEEHRSNRVLFWGGIVSLVLLIKLLVETL